MKKIILYYAPNTRAVRTRWMLEELGVPYDLKLVNLSKKEQKSDEYLKIHPLGFVPALYIDDQLLMESGAQCVYLAEIYPEKKLAPALDSKERLEFLQWIFFMQNNVEPHLVTYFEQTILFPADKRIPSLIENCLPKLSSALKVVESELKGKEFFLNDFSAVDVFAGSMLIWAKSLKLLGDYPLIENYIDKLKSRFAYQKAIKN